MSSELLTYGPWVAAMLLAALWLRGDAMWRTWFALIFSCAGGWFAHLWLSDATHVPATAFYITFDFFAALLILNRPRQPVQEVICWTIISMMVVEIAYIWSGQANPTFVGQWNFALGWVQVALLLGWGLEKRYGYIDRFGRLADAFRSSEKNRK